MPYPTITQALIDCAYITDAELARDLTDTQRELAEEQQKLSGYRALAQTSGPNAKLNHILAQGTEQRIAEMQELITFLEQLQAARKEG